MYPLSPLAALFLQVFGCGCLIYLVWQAITNPLLALKYAAYFVYLIGTVFGLGIAAAKLYPEEFSFIRGAALGVAILLSINWVYKKISGDTNG